MATTSGLVVLLVLQGCSTVGPRYYEASFNDYTDAISRTSDGQMLGNLVRMRYYQSPVFLQVSNVTTSFSVGGNAGASIVEVLRHLGHDVQTASAGDMDIAPMR